MYSVLIYSQESDIPAFASKESFHSKELFDIYRDTPGYNPYLIVAYDDGMHVAHLLSVVRDNKRLFLHTLFRRCVIYGCGEYVDELKDKEKVFGIMLHKLNEEILRFSFLVEFRNLDDHKFGYKYFRENNYFPIYWMRVVNNLNAYDNLEKLFSSSRLRQVKKGLKNGATVDEAKTSQDVEVFSQTLHYIYSSHIRKHFPDKLFFYHLYQHCTKSHMAKLFLVHYKNKIIGGSVCIYSGGTAYLWFSGGMRKTYIRQYPGVLAVWKALTDAKLNGYDNFEFLDAGMPYKQMRYRDFILRYGGTQSSTRRWLRFRWKWLNDLFIRMYS